MSRVIKNNEYIGWIPTLSGRLYFDNWECSGVLSKSFTKSYSINQQGEKKTRRVLLSNSINWRDLKFLHDGNFKVILISKSRVGDDKVKGKVYIYPHSFISKSFFSKNKNTLLKEINNKIKEASRLAEEKENVKEIFEETRELLSTIKDLKEFYVVDFEIDKRGFTTLSYNSEHSYKDVNQDTPLIICRQAFYFIKYSLHYHQHHSAKDDSLTEIHINSDDAAFKMIKDLKKGLVNMKRGFEVTGHYCLFNAGGIVAYTKSLVESCYADKKIEIDEYKKEISYLKNTSDSLNKTAENEERIASQEASISNSFRSIILVLLAIFTPLVILFKKEIHEKTVKDDGDFIDLISSLLASFYSSANLYLFFWVVVGILYFGVIKSTRKRGGMSVDRFLLTRLKILLKKPTKAQYLAVAIGLCGTLFFTYYIVSIVHFFN